MIINRVKVENYRKHESKEVFFTKGINLLLGENGSGKSSILEAAGHALFNADLRNKRSTPIKKFMKSATIIVEFTGNDEIDYIVERRLGKGAYHKLRRAGESAVLRSGITDVVNYISELSGIEANEGEIYNSVITASQNKFTDCFAGTSGSRKESFDKIFGTEIYREIYVGFSREITSSYIAKISKIEGEILAYQVSGEAKEDLEKQISEADIKYAQLNNEINNYKDELEKKREDLQQIEKLKNDFKHAQSEFEGKNALINSQKSSLSQRKLDLESAVNSKKIVEEKRENHIKYKDWESALKSVEATLRVLDAADIKRQDAEKKKSVISQSIASLKSKLLIQEKQVKEKETTIEDLNKKNESLHDSMQKVENDYYISNQQYEINKNVYHSFLKIWEEYSLIKNGLIAEKVQLNKLNEEIIDEARVKALIKDLLKEILEYDNKNKKYIDFNSEIKTEERALKELMDAKAQLSGGSCPILKTECRNITDGLKPNDYFLLKEKEISYKISNLQNEAESLKTAEEILNKKRRTETQFNESLRQNELRKKHIETCQEKIKNAELVIENKTAEFKNILQIEDLEELDNLKDTQIQKLSSSESELYILKQNFETSKDLYEESLLDLQKSNENLQRLISSVEAVKLELNNGTDELAEVENIINQLEQELTAYISKKEERTSIVSELAALKSDYESFIKYYPDSEKVNPLKNDIQKIEEEIEKLNKEAEELKKKIEKLTQSYSAEEELKISNDNKELQDNISQTQLELTKIYGSLESLKNNLKSQKEREAKLRTALISKNLMEKKYDLAVKLRENINGMGALVAERILKSLEAGATNNFRSITGRNESVKWLNKNDESYAVYLAPSNDPDSWMFFSELSGGEQVAIALAIRAAMASALTKADFAIFDEPTINLDDIRKEALSQSLDKVLSRLRQAIVVTHDSSFEHIASNTIRL